jgi:hypothetical protein
MRGIGRKVTGGDTFCEMRGLFEQWARYGHYLQWLGCYDLVKKSRITMKMMFVLSGWIVFASIFGVSAPKAWIPAKYHGIVVGRSSVHEVIKILGRPKSFDREQDTGIPTVSYDVADPVEGDLAIYLDHDKVSGMTLYPKQQLPAKEAIRIFGPAFLNVRYERDDCLDNGGAAPIYESSTGSIMHIEYRERGLALILSDKNNNNVEAIAFVAKPFGPSHSRCKK